MTDRLKNPADADRIARVRGSLKMLEAKLGDTHARIISDAEQLIYDLTPSVAPEKQGQFELRKRIMFAIFDPGASEGFKGDRDLTTWQGGR